MNTFFKPVALFLFLLSAFTAFSQNAVKKPLKLSFTGDMMAHVINYSMKDYSLIYKNIEYIIKNDSLTFCNIEFPINSTIPQASYPVFNIHPEYVEAGIDAGIDVMSIANNHIGDQDLQGLFATVDSFNMLKQSYKEKGRHIFFAGASNKKNKTPKVEIIEKNGWKIGFVAVTQFSNTTIEEGYLSIVDYRKEKEAKDFLNWVKNVSQDFDIFILSYHAGVEYQKEADNLKNNYFKQLVSAGADIIWGHHPHVIQPIEIFTFDDRKSVVMNSMGNFISGQGRISDPILPEEDWSYTGDSAIVQVDISFDGTNTNIDDVSAIPIANFMDTNRNVLIVPIEKLTRMAIPEPWIDYFIERFIFLHDFINRNIQFHE